MNTRRLGTTDFELTPIGLGCMQFSNVGAGGSFYAPTAQETVTDIVRTSMESGVNWFDTAEMYGHGHSERALTTALHELGVRPGEVTVATKWPPLGRSARSIGATVQDRIDALQGFPIDLHQIHMPWGSLSPISSQVEAMARLQSEGRIASIGVSSFSAKQMERSRAVLRSHGMSLASNQIQLSLLHREAERNGVLKTAREFGVTLIAFSPLRSGMLTGKFHDEPERLASVKPIRRLIGRFNRKELERTAPLIDELKAVAAAHGVTVSQIALAWLVTFYGDTVVAIPGASRPEQAAESAAAAEIKLSDMELNRLDEVSKSIARNTR
ncbi:aldo/keto reductase [Glycomyces tenuis]|uniref:aldo/keto reductase n=1 Tax=Glycomyces tenuis TaxID=58116 RepID=UPI0003F9724D|nr:aldo/keto reductase [Glycomyces tenuis]